MESKERRGKSDTPPLFQTRVQLEICKPLPILAAIERTGNDIDLLSVEEEEEEQIPGNTPELAPLSFLVSSTAETA